MHKIILLGFVLIISTMCNKAPKETVTKQQLVPVLAKNPKMKDIPVFVETVGTLKPMVLVEIRPQLGGIIEEIFIKEGDWVKENQLLLKIDPSMHQVKLDEANAQLNMDRVGVNTAQRKLERYRKLAQKDLVAQTEWDDIEAQVGKSLAMIDLDNARFQAASLDLAHCSLYSPIAGRVGKLDIHRGMLVSSGDILAKISQFKTLSLEFFLSESEFSDIFGQDVVVEITSLCQKSKSETCKKGLVVFHDHHFDAKTGQIFFKAQIPNEDLKLHPGQVVSIHIPIGINHNALTIQQKSVKYNDQGPFVYVVLPDQTSAQRQIVLGEEFGNEVIVLQGLEEVDLVVTDGHLRLSPGTKVEVKS